MMESKVISQVKKLNSESSGMIGLLNEKQAAAVLNVQPRTLQFWRFAGRGPQFIRISHRCIRYRFEDLEAFTQSLVRQNTSQL